MDKDIEAVERGAGAGIMHLIGQTELTAGKSSRLGKKVLINIGYNILKRNLRHR